MFPSLSAPSFPHRRRRIDPSITIIAFGFFVSVSASFHTVHQSLSLPSDGPHRPLTNTEGLEVKLFVGHSPSGPGPHPSQEPPGQQKQHPFIYLQTSQSPLNALPRQDLIDGQPSSSQFVSQQTFDSELKSRRQSPSKTLQRRQEPGPSTSLAASNTKAYPQPFDTSLGTDFESETCAPFVERFVRDPNFQACHPFSLLLTTSQAFFRAVQTSAGAAESSPGTSAVTLREILDRSCQANTEQCSLLFDQLAIDIKSTRSGCGRDIEKRNPLALEALEGLSNYRLMREIGCLQTAEQPSGLASPTNSSSSNSATAASTNSTITPQMSSKYCFEKAVASSTPDDMYYYYLASGTGLPSGTKTNCDQCVRSIMKLYATAADNPSLAVQSTYPSARTMTNLLCGPGFAPMPLRFGSRSKSDAGGRRAKSNETLIMLGWMWIAFLGFEWAFG